MHDDFTEKPKEPFCFSTSTGISVQLGLFVSIPLVGIFVFLPPYLPFDEREFLYNAHHILILSRFSLKNNP